MSLAVTGTVGIDTIYTPDGDHREGVLGGSGAYFAAAANFYGPVRMIAAVGEDFPADLHGTLGSFKNIDTEGLEVRSGSKTFRWGGKYMENMDHRETVFTDLNVLIEDPPKVPDAFSDSRLLFLANMHPGVQLKMMEQFPKRTLCVADTMDIWIENEREALGELMTKVDGLALNYDEAEQLTGKRNTVTAARELVKMGPKFVVVKKGEHGCIFVHREGIAALPAFPSETVVDPTGAGDSFAGGMFGHLARATEFGRVSDVTSFETLRRALAHGTVMASFTIEAFSLERLASLSYEEIDRRFDEYAQMMNL